LCRDPDPCSLHRLAMERQSLGSQEPDTAFTPRDLLDLFIRPARFFAVRARQLGGPALKLVAWAGGMNYAFGRIERQMVRADLGRESGTASIVSGSWPKFWALALVAGLLSAVAAWYIGAWWYRVRLRWSGDANAPIDRARTVYLYAGLIWAVPNIIWNLGDTVRFPDFATAWADESAWDLLLLLFPIWSVWASYRGVRAVFAVRPGRARFWFLIMPIMALLFSFGIIAALYARMG
jgi:hypothetical protein